MTVGTRVRLLRPGVFQGELGTIRGNANNSHCVAELDEGGYVNFPCDWFEAFPEPRPSVWQRLVGFWRRASR